jgi:hypothetical protein
MMEGVVADEKTIRCEEQIGVRARQTRQRVKGDTIHGRKDRSREVRVRIEFNPMDVVVIGHRLLLYSSSSLPPLFIRLAHSKMSHYGNLKTIIREEKESRMWDCWNRDCNRLLC